MNAVVISMHFESDPFDQLLVLAVATKVKQASYPSRSIDWTQNIVVTSRIFQPGFRNYYGISDQFILN